MRKLIAPLLASACIVCAWSSAASADETDLQQKLVARQTARHALSHVMSNRAGEARGAGDLPKMNTALAMLPYFKGRGGSASQGSRTTRVGFRFAGRETETIPVTVDGKVIGQEMRVVTRFFNKGTETTTVKTAQLSAQDDYKFHRSVLGRTRSWEAHSTSSELKQDGRTVNMTASAQGGDNRQVGVHATGAAQAHVTEGSGKTKATVGHARISSAHGWAD